MKPCGLGCQGNQRTLDRRRAGAQRRMGAQATERGETRMRGERCRSWVSQACRKRLWFRTFGHAGAMQGQGTGALTTMRRMLNEMRARGPGMFPTNSVANRCSRDVTESICYKQAAIVVKKDMKVNWRVDLKCASNVCCRTDCPESEHMQGAYGVLAARRPRRRSHACGPLGARRRGQLEHLVRDQARGNRHDLA